MYKVLIVDDEPQIRQGLKAKIRWDEHGFECCGEAGDGKEALKIIAHEQPHVVITDIRMPRMDGVKLLSSCVEQYPAMRLIVLSGYEDFEYVKSALQYGAKDYLLKPVVRKELISRLEQIRKELDEERKEEEAERVMRMQLLESKEKLREQFWLQAVRAATEATEWLVEANRLGLGYLLEQKLPLRFATFSVQKVKGDGEAVRDALLLQAVYMMTRELVELWGEAAFLFRDPAAPGRFHLALLCATFGEESLEQWLKNDFRLKLESMLRVRMKLGIGETVQDFSDWRKGFISSRVRWMQLQPQRSKPSEEDPSHAEHFELSPIMERALTAAIDSKDPAALIRELRSLLYTNPPLTMHALYLRALRLLLFFHTLSLKRGQAFEDTELIVNSLPESLWPCQTPEETEALFLRLAKPFMEHIKDSHPSSGEEIVQRIAAYLQEHYADEDISLSDMSRRFHLHVTYLSELFKKLIGKNYSEYVTEIRITKAKELLRRAELKVSDIAELAGFSNPNYFSRVFKKSTGFSPVEYRSRNY